MTITLEIGPELQTVLARQAAARGIGVDAHAANLLNNAAGVPPAPRNPDAARPLRT